MKSSSVLYPRVYVTPYLHARVKSLAEKKGLTMLELGKQIVTEGLRVVSSRK